MPLMVSCNWSLFSSGRHCLPESISDLTDWGHSSTRLPSLQTPVASPGRQNWSTGCESGFPQPPLREEQERKGLGFNISLKGTPLTSLQYVPPSKDSTTIQAQECHRLGTNTNTQNFGGHSRSKLYSCFIFYAAQCVFVTGSLNKWPGPLSTLNGMDNISW
jgi:hypothetical protein